MDILTRKHNQIIDILKNIHLYNLENIKLDKALYLESIYAIQFDEKKRGIKKWIKLQTKILKSFFIGINDIYLNGNGNDILFLITLYNRPDHDNYYKMIREMVPKRDEIYLFSSGKNFFQQVKKINLKGFFDRWRIYRNAYKSLSEIESKTVKQLLSSDIVRCALLKRKIDSLSVKPKVLISFFDANMLENVIIQALKKYGTVSLTNQHGQPIFRGYDIDHINQSQILNFSSDYYLAKGEFTKKQFEIAGIDNKKIKIIGSAIPVINKKYNEINSGKFSVFLDSPSLDFSYKTNREILKFCEEFSATYEYNYILKLHPLDSIDNYSDINIEHCCKIFEPRRILSDVFSEIEFAIFGASSIYLDLLINRIKSFQLKIDVDFPIVENEFDIIFSTEELSMKLNKWKNMSIDEKDNYFNSTIKNYIDNTDFQKNITDLLVDIKKV